MNIKLGAPLAAACGSLGGTTFVRSRSSLTARAGVRNCNNSSAKSSQQRSTFCNITQRWRGLTAAQRLQWKTFGKNYPQRNALGFQYFLSGFLQYSKINLQLLASGQALIAVPGAVSQLQFISSFTATVSHGAVNININISPSLNSTHRVIIYATGLCSPGQQNPRSGFRMMRTFNQSTAFPQSIISQWQAQYGAILPVGQVIFFKALIVQLFTGITSGPYLTRSVIS